LSFMVSGPFIAPSTNIKVEFTDTDVEVYYWMKKNGKTLQQIPSGHVFQFSNTEAAREVMLVIKRKSLGMGSGYTTTALKTYVDITRIQGGVSHPTHVSVIFNPTRLFCRNGAAVRGSGFSVASANAIELPEPLAGGNRAYIEQKSGYLRVSNTVNDELDKQNNARWCPLMSGVQFDMEKFNVFYAVLTNRASVWNVVCLYDNDWDGAWTTDGNGNRVPRNNDTIYNIYQHSWSLSDTEDRKNEEDMWINRMGSHTIKCFLHKERDPRNAIRSLDLYIGKVHGELKVLEFGIITYDTSLL